MQGYRVVKEGRESDFAFLHWKCQSHQIMAEEPGLQLGGHPSVWEGCGFRQFRQTHPRVERGTQAAEGGGLAVG